jgi:arylsulfatase A-like enzyme
MLKLQRRSFAALLLPALAAGCAPRPAPEPVAIRLTEIYKPEMVEGRAAGAAPELPRIEWRFDGKPGPSTTPPAANGGWQAGPGVAELGLHEGRLAGRTTDDVPILHVERTTGLDNRDQLHAVEVRARVSAGAEISISFRESEKVDLAEIAKEAKDAPWRLTAALSPGPEAKTYLFDTQARRGIAASEARHVLLRPSNVKGARFEIESVRLITRREHLAAVPSGLGWQGLSEVYRETLVARAPEAIRVKLRLPARPLLDLGIGTIENSPVTFRVGVRRGSEPETILLQRTVSTPHRWEDTPIDLARFAGERVTLSLALAADNPGAIGFWGAPAVRSLGARPASAGADAPQGVIVIWSDTTRRDHLSAYGYERDTTPTLRRMAAEGALFKDCIDQATWTKVATPSLMTSLYPISHGVRDFSDRLPSSAVTLAEVFQDAGYATLSLSSILFTGRWTNLHQGFEQVHEDASLPDKESSKTARIYVDRLLPWLEAHREVPFFVFLHVSDPHDPYRPYAPYDTLWADPKKRDEHERQAKEVKKFISAPLLKLFGMPTRDDLKRAGFDADAYAAYDRDWYDGSIRAMDVEIGRLLERLHGLGLDGKTLVVYTGDHGEEFLEHGRTFHGQSTYGELANAPLIVWRPGAVRKGTVVDQTVETIDIMPTLLEISGLPSPAGIQGHSLLPLLSPAGASAGTVHAASGWDERPALTEKAVTSEPLGAPPPQETESFAIVAGPWKLIHNTARPAGKPEYELFEHPKDPLDSKDLAALHPDVVERLAKEIAAWRSKGEAARLKPDAASAQQMSPEQLDRLRALGYIQ